MNSYQQSASIEGEGLKFKTRQFFSRPPVRKDGKVRYGFKMGIRSSAELTKAFENPEMSEFSTSMLSVGDSLNAQAISGWCSKRHSEPVVKKGSASHSATHGEINSTCFAMIDACAKEHLDNPDFMAKFPPIEMTRRVLIENSSEAQKSAGAD